MQSSNNVKQNIDVVNDSIDKCSNVNTVADLSSSVDPPTEVVAMKELRFSLCLVLPLSLFRNGKPVPFALLVLAFLCLSPRNLCPLGCAPGCDAGGRESETLTGPTLRVFK